MLILADLKAFDFSELRHCVSAGEALNPEVTRVWEEATGKTIYEAYGQTETVMVIGTFPCIPNKPGSIGKPAPGWCVQLHDEQGNEVPVGEEGKIAIKTKDPSWFMGRDDDIIKSSGYRIGPTEVESALIEHPAVKESAVVGSPDPIRGVIVKAFVILKDGWKPSDELVKELQNHVKKTTAPYKYPRAIEFVEDLPKTISGKVRRVELRDREMKRYQALHHNDPESDSGSQ